MKFMECTTCKGVVQINNTGTCLGCQRGFTSEPQEDAWILEEEKNEDTLDKLLEKRKELEDALKEIKKPIGSISEHPGIEAVCIPSKTSCGNKPKQSRKKKETNKKG